VANATTAKPAKASASLPAPVVLLLAVTTGMSVASLYYAQPLLEAMRRSLHMGTSTAGLVVSVTQVGYLAGLVLLVPLGDMFARRRLVPLMAAGLAGLLALLSASPDAGVLLAASLLVGAASVTAQVSVAFGATLAADEDRGRIVGTIMSGLLLGILLARTAAGWLGQAGSWRTPYQVAAGAVAVLAMVLWRYLPADPVRSRPRYRQLLVSVPRLLVEEPIIALRSLYGALAFGAFNALWTPLAFLLSGPPYRYSTSLIGLFGLLGVAGAAAASFAGRVADRGGAAAMTGVTAALLLAAWAAVAAGRHHLGALVAGIVVLDFAVQGLHITNQSLIYRLRPEARSRITSAYMALYFAGGVAGSVAATSAYTAGGWGASSAVGAGFGLAAVLLYVAEVVGRRRASDQSGPAHWRASQPTRPAGDRRESPG
jgi:predicted MFS family arabinose efflux permease